MDPVKLSSIKRLIDEKINLMEMYSKESESDCFYFNGYKRKPQCFQVDFEELCSNEEEIRIITKWYYAKYLSNFISLMWDGLPEYLKADERIQDCRRCLEHHNQPGQRDHIDGPAPMKRDCRQCQEKKKDDYVRYAWDYLPEYLKTDSRVLEQRRCLEHHNQPGQRDHIDGPAPMIRDCRQCQKKK